MWKIFIIKCLHERQILVPVSFNEYFIWPPEEVTWIKDNDLEVEIKYYYLLQN